jgi:hypothetical protein
MRIANWTWLLILTACAAGCSSGRIVSGQASLPKDETSAAFLDRAASQRDVTEDDALRGMILLLEEKDDCADFQARVKKLSERGIVWPQWDFVADRPITKGRLAYMVCQACKVQGGLTFTLLGPSERYCLRELQYQKFMVGGLLNTPVSGMEFVAILGRADEYMRTGRVPEVLRSASETRWGY